MEDVTQRHVWQHLRNPKVVIVVVGCVALVVGAWVLVGKKTDNVISPSSGPEGTTVTMTLSKDVAAPLGAQLLLVDPGEHGYVAKQTGGGTYVTYDPTTGLTYKVSVTKGQSNADKQSVSATVPAGVCGLIIKSAQEPNPAPKVLNVTLVGSDGKQVAGTPKGTFQVACDTYTLKIKMTASKDPVLPDGADSSTVTATLSVSGPAQFINGKQIPIGAQKPILDTPLGLLLVQFTTDLGVLAPPSPAKVKTDLAGQASVVISSQDAGIANVHAVALAIGDAIQKVHFPPKIVAVKMDFVPPQSPTNYQMKTIPANAKDLTFGWTFIPAAGNNCGHLTGAVSGKGESANGFYHGPSDGFPDGCPEDWEHASQMKVALSDKDGQSDTKTFGARAYEGQGFVNLK